MRSLSGLNQRLIAIAAMCLAIAGCGGSGDSEEVADPNAEPSTMEALGWRRLDSTPPIIRVTSPTSGSSLETSSATVVLGGSASDNRQVSRVTWVTDKGYSGTATQSKVSSTVSWTTATITLVNGTNNITVRAYDKSGNVGSATIAVAYDAPTSAAATTSTTPTPTTTTTATGMPASPALTGAVYTDVTSVPVGGYVTVYGIASGSSDWTIAYQGNDRTVVQAPSNAALGPTTVTVNGVSIPLSIHSGRVITATPSTLASVVNNLQPGDTVYLRAGTYSGKYDSEGWNESNFVLFRSGTASQPIAFLAYPGEVVTISNSNDRPNFHLGDGGSRRADYLTIAGFNLVNRQECISGGGNTANSNTPESGAAYVRVVGNSCSLTDTTANTMTGMVSAQGDGWKILGNTFINPPNRAIINNNHGIYIQNGADDVEVAYNVLTNLRMGHVIQIHQDGTPMLYERLNIHHNLLQAANNMDMRGITVSNVDSNSTITIANNTLRNLGQDFSGIAVYRGKVTLSSNELYDVNAPAILISNQAGGTRSITATGNRLGVVSGQPYFLFDVNAPATDLKASGNSYCGGGTPPSLDASATGC